jgi:hypothetical protein
MKVLDRDDDHKLSVVSGPRNHLYRSPSKLRPDAVRSGGKRHHVCDLPCQLNPESGPDGMQLRLRSDGGSAPALPIETQVHPMRCAVLRPFRDRAGRDLGVAGLAVEAERSALPPVPSGVHRVHRGAAADRGAQPISDRIDQPSGLFVKLGVAADQFGAQVGRVSGRPSASRRRDDPASAPR